jgi:hypothetical protein
MKKIFIILFVCFFHQYSFSQDFPSKIDIIKAIGEYANANDIEINFNTKKEIKYYDANYSKSNRKERICICPVLYGYNTREAVLLYYLDKNNTWKNDITYVSENAPYSDETTEPIDVNRDSIYEFLFQLHSMRRGYEKWSVKIISFSINDPNVFYENEGFELPGEDEFGAGLAMGDKVYEKYFIEFDDVNKDGMPEILEKVKTGYLLKKTKDMDDYWTYEVEPDSVINTYFFKSNKFVISK